MNPGPPGSPGEMKKKKKNKGKNKGKIFFGPKIKSFLIWIYQSLGLESRFVRFTFFYKWREVFFSGFDTKGSMFIIEILPFVPRCLVCILPDEFRIF